jgi:hypothetical protein
MNNPRSQPTKWGIPVNLETGVPYTDAQISRLEKLKAAHAALLEVMHECEGTQGDKFSTRRMSIAATQIELGILMARAAATETP